VRNWNKPVNEEADQLSQTRGADPLRLHQTKTKNKMLIIAIEDFIVFYVFFGLINSSIGAYKQYKKTIANTDYEMTSYFTWFTLWWVFLPKQIAKLF
jgi:hypothetical protein